MIICPSCDLQNPSQSERCLECGAALNQDQHATGANEATVSHWSDAESSSTEFSMHGRFLPGTKIADRYRIVSLIGKGGMGEVYRADDLKLGHTIALKFLPRNLEDSPRRLEYFHNEVRLARQISHPNVCRVYDIGSVDGQHYLSMEYIDGEDLKVLLRRIGKLGQDKGIQIARQLCAGLAAAHERGVLHRDLKPANIMLDGRGQVRITDFGLAKLIQDGHDSELEGTPAYMSPEQLQAKPVTIQSDLYSLGLVLVELLTGQKVRNSDSIHQLRQQAGTAILAQTLQLPPDIAPTAQKAIFSCLEPEPQDRPVSAAAVAAALPGGDPLAAALAAGETPSPEMVAASGSSGVLPVSVAGLCFVAILAVLALTIWLRGLASPTAGLNHSAGDYAERAREILGQLRLLDQSSMYEYYQFDWGKIPDSQKPKKAVVEFWYRRSPVLLMPELEIKEVFTPANGMSLNNPPNVTSGMASLRLNRTQKLRELFYVPPQRGPKQKPLSNPTPEQRDRELLLLTESVFSDEIAGLPLTDDNTQIDRFSENKRFFLDLDTPFQALYPFDEQFVFRPLTDKDRNIEKVEMGFINGQLTYFRVFEKGIVSQHVSPWRNSQPPNVTDPAGEGKLDLVRDDSSKSEQLDWADGMIQQIKGPIDRVPWLIQLIITPLSLYLAMRNWTFGRSDRRTAWRLAVFMFVVVFLKSRFDMGFHLEYLRESVWVSAGQGFSIYIWYLAFEPMMRKFWPGILTGWSRAAMSRWENPRVGQEVLIGVGLGVFIVFGNVVLQGETASVATNPTALSGINGTLATILELTRFISGWGLYLAILLVLCRILLKQDFPAICLALTMHLLFWHLQFLVKPDNFIFVLLIYYVTFMLLITRLGLLAAFSFLFANHLLAKLPISSDQLGPDVLPTVAGIAIIGLISSLAFFVSIGGKRWLAVQSKPMAPFESGL